MNTFNAQPKPRVLFEAVPKEKIDELVRLVPSYKIINVNEDVHETEYDILVTFAYDAGTRAKHLHVLSFGAIMGTPSDKYLFDRKTETLANEVTISSGVQSPIAALLKKTVIPHIPEGPKNIWQVLFVEDREWQHVDTDDLRGQCSPLLHLGKEKFVYAYRNRRDGSKGGLQVALPEITREPAEWLRLFLDLVAEIDPVSVPPEAEWKTSERWSPPEVGGFIRAIQTVKDERERAMFEFHAREQALNGDLNLAVQRAEAGPGRLLTADGDALTAAVLEALQDLGFSAQDMDDHHDEKTGAKLEDLRVDDPSEPDWHCLAEVKGYTKGAKVNDVSQITGRPVAAFTKETGDYPSTVWHIVNTWRGKPPSTRPVAIPNDDDLRPVTDASGALIDTRDLFEAWRDVQDGKVGADAVRTSMRSSLTRWTYDPSLLQNQ
ncbi:hypothetical protein [Arthrobacter sp. ZBG10]|uniref:hypothetical protein n=1 Tax=Arthrobacter sp. ZBG10 TaxID=1676590 RepID=UPI0012F8C852|nr:hypothetical protein [Arthrobacter sp. ZBG10]